MASRWAGFGRRAAAVDADGAGSRQARPPTNSNPLKMAGREPLQGYVVAFVLLVVAILNLLVTTGKGAPKHPELWWSYIGIVFAAGLAVSIRFENRIASGFVAIFGAFFVTLGKAPDRLAEPHLAALIIAVAYAVVMSVRQRRDQKAVGPTASTARGRSGSGGRRRRGEPEAPAGPVRPPPSRRYTPPKPPKDRTRRR